MTWKRVVLIEILLKVLLLTELLLEFKWSVWHNHAILPWKQKLTWFSKTDENLKYYWESEFYKIIL